MPTSPIVIVPNRRYQSERREEWVTLFMNHSYVRLLIKNLVAPAVSVFIYFPKKLARLLGRIEGCTMNPITIITILGPLALGTIIVLILVHMITLIIGNYIGINEITRFWRKLAIIGTVELVVSFAIASCVEYYAVPYLFQLPTDGFGMIASCVFTIVALLTILLAYAYYLGYKHGFNAP